MLVQVVLSLLACWSGAHAMYILEEAPQLFEDFIHKYEKTYATEAEKQHRFNVFVQNLEVVNRRNEQLKQPVHGINKFSDMTAKEFKDKYTCYLPTTDSEVTAFQNASEYLNYVDAPESFDWRTRNVVSSVKSQSPCGACYAFSAVGNIEGQYAIKYRQLVSLSPQQILDCDKQELGCTGGWPEKVIDYVSKAGGIELDSDYPYAGRVQQCQFDRRKAKVQVSRANAAYISSQEQLKQLLFQTGPLSFSLDGERLKTYHGNILVNCPATLPNHSVLLVGYGADSSGTQYWIVKNSWGANWGEQGYFRLERGEDKGSCGMLIKPISSAVVA